MKTQEEIEQLAEQWFENSNTERWGGEVDGFIQGYTQCQEKEKEQTDIIKTQKELIDLLYGQVVDLSVMSKIELGDDVIAEIHRLKSKLGYNEV